MPFEPSASSRHKPRLGAAGPAPEGRLAQLAAMLPSLQLMIGLVTAAVVIAALHFGRDILMPLALAFLMGFVLDPLVSRLKRWGLPRLLAVVLVLAATMALLGGVGLLLGSQVRALSAELPTYQSNIKTKLVDLRERLRAPGVLDGALKTFDTVQKEVENAQATEPASGRGRAPAAQRVQVVEPPASPFEQALVGFGAAAGPLASAGIVLVFVFLILADRQDLRDRLLRLLGGNLHRSTDAMDEAGARIGRYLIMQIVVNAAYGVPMALGLWWIGVPGALLWGAVAAVLRFVPYIGPMISAVFPLALAFAVDPGWNMLLWTAALIVALELVINNVVEPLLYGSSTGLSALSLIVAATFWTALWGPMGLVMSTPLTVCLLVLGRYLPQLQFLEVLLGAQPALDAPTRVYQRLLAGDAEEAIELAEEEVRAGSVVRFYDEIGVPVLRMASSDHASVASAEHRLRVVSGMQELIEELREDEPGAAAPGPVQVVCIGGKWEVDTLSAMMLAHALALAGHRAEHRAAEALGADDGARLDLHGARTVCVCYFSEEPRKHARHLCRRLRRRWPGVRIVLVLWNAPPALLEDEALASIGADAAATSVDEAVMRVGQSLGRDPDAAYLPAALPPDENARLQALHASRARLSAMQPEFELAAKRVADVFDLPLGMVSLVDEREQIAQAVWGQQPEQGGEAAHAVSTQEMSLPRAESFCGHVVAEGRTLVVPDVERDPRFAGNPALGGKGWRFYAGAPLRDEEGRVLGTLCVLDVEPRGFDARETRLLEAMAADLMERLAQGEAPRRGAGEQGIRPAPPAPLPSAPAGRS